MSDTSASPALEVCLDHWHAYLRGELEGGLDAILDDDVVFSSPIVFTPQRGKELTKMYLMAAGATLGGEQTSDASASSSESDSACGEWNGKFRYVRIIREGNDALLEFETTVDGKYMNGVDLITCNDESRIIDFKVMVRPLQAINLIHEQMRAALEMMSAT